MSATLKYLQKARDLIANPENWVPGRRRIVKEKGGYAYCALGALDEVIHESLSRVRRCDPTLVALDAVIPRDKIVGKHDPYNYRISDEPDNCASRIAGYNNLMGHKKTVALFDRAIANEREHPQQKVES